MNQKFPCRNFGLMMRKECRGVLVGRIIQPNSIIQVILDLTGVIYSFSCTCSIVLCLD